MSGSSVEILSLSKLVKEAAVKAARKEVGPGEYPVSLTVKVEGTLTVGEAEEARPTSAIPTLAALALALKYAGVTREAAKAAIILAMGEALAAAAQSGYEAGASEKALRAAHPEVVEGMAAIKAALDTLPKQPKSGKVMFAGSVETLSGS